MGIYYTAPHSGGRSGSRSGSKSGSDSTYLGPAFRIFGKIPKKRETVMTAAGPVLSEKGGSPIVHSESPSMCSVSRFHCSWAPGPPKRLIVSWNGSGPTAFSKYPSGKVTPHVSEKHAKPRYERMSDETRPQMVGLRH